MNYYWLDTLTYPDYYPFGMLMPNRHGSDVPAGEDYAYGMGGMEKDNEINGNNNSYTTYFIQYDPRIARWTSMDPLVQNFPWQSPYVGFDNNPIYYNDPSGAASKGPGDPPKRNKNYTTVTWETKHQNIIVLSLFPFDIRSQSISLMPLSRKAYATILQMAFGRRSTAFFYKIVNKKRALIN